MAEKTIILNRPNWLASEVGLVTVTHTFESTTTGYVTENGRKILKSGLIYPTNDASAKGIVFTDVDITDGDMQGSLMIAGRYLNGKLSAAVATTAKTVFQGQGLFGQEVPTDVFPEDGTLSK